VLIDRGSSFRVTSFGRSDRTLSLVLVAQRSHDTAKAAAAEMPDEEDDGAEGDFFADRIVEDGDRLADLIAHAFESHPAVDTTKSIDELLAISDQLLKAGWEEVPRDDKGRWTGDGRTSRDASTSKPATDLRSMTKQEFADHLTSTVPGVQVITRSSLDIYPDFRADLVKELTTLTRDYPLQEKIYINSRPMSGYGMSDNQTIHLSERWFGGNGGGRAALEKELARDNKKDRFHDGMTDPMIVVAHEYGHHIDAEMAPKNWATATAGQKGGPVRSWAATQNTKPYRGKDAVTGYARIDSGEWFAESFAAGVRGYGDSRAQSAPGVDKVREAVTRHFDASKASLAKGGWEDVPRDDKGRWTGDGSRDASTSRDASSAAAHRAHITMLQRKLEGANAEQRAKIEAKIAEHQRAIEGATKPAEKPAEKPAAEKPAAEKPLAYSSMSPNKFVATMNAELKAAGTNVSVKGAVHPDLRQEFATELKTLATQYPIDWAVTVSVEPINADTFGDSPGCLARSGSTPTGSEMTPACSP
jgi:hypothetical protein